MDTASTISLGMAFMAGLLSFVSPCVLPIVPSFLGFISGMSLDQMTGEDAGAPHSVLLYTAWFVVGFSLVFVALGASATMIGSLLLKYQKVFRIAGGLFIMILGLQFMGLFQIAFLQTERRMHLDSKPMGVLGSFLVGITFGLGWTPCIGPILGSILMMAATQASVSKGIWMLSAYSLGFALPFIIAAAALNKFLTTYRRFSKYIPKVVFASGVFLVVIGLLFMTNRFAMISEFLTGWIGV